MYLGLDIGTTTLKAAAYDARRGRRLAHASIPLALRTDATGRREQDPAALVAALTTVLATVRRRCGRRWSTLQGIGLAAQGGSTLVVDRATGRPHSPLILWNDTRAFAHFHRLAATLPPHWWRSFSRRDEPAMGLARACWLRDRNPRLLEGDRLLVGLGEYVFFLLTGLWRQDPCHALQSGCYDGPGNRLTTRPLRRLGLAPTLAAPLRSGHDPQPGSAAAARRFALPAGVPVAGPYNDHEAGFASILHASARPLAASLGTAWVGNFALADASRGRSPFQLCVPAPDGNGCQVIQPLMTGNVTLEWAEANLLDATPGRAEAHRGAVLRRQLLPPAGLTALPWLNRPHPLKPSVIGGAGFFGAGPATTREDLYRALAAGMVFEFGRVFAPVREGRAVDSLVLCGGRAASPALRALFAAVWVPHPVFAVVEPAFMGTRGALLAFDRQLARASVAPVDRSRLPEVGAIEAARELYHAAFTRFCGQVPAGAAYQLLPPPRPSSAP
ncbi:MAG: hypothetical protein HZC55_07785 [Verrucomicrobia bacterium]|nr:hypothetical protein [Verrucomicrobiota bacterium]